MNCRPSTQQLKQQRTKINENIIYVTYINVEIRSENHMHQTQQGNVTQRF